MPEYSSANLRRKLVRTSYLLFLLYLLLVYFLGYYATVLLFTITHSEFDEHPISYIERPVPCVRETSESKDTRPRKTMHVMTDKPIYRPGETMFMRGIELWASDPNEFRMPKDSASYKNWNFKMVSSMGTHAFYAWLDESQFEASPLVLQIVIQPHPENDFIKIISASWTVPESIDGGDYTLSISRGSDYLEGSRSIQIRTYVLPRLKISIEFLDAGYGPGDRVKVRIHITRTEDGDPPIGTEVRVSNGNASVNYALDESGIVLHKFFLEEDDLERETAVRVTVMDDGVTESSFKLVPMVSKVLNIEFFPESGNLIPGVENRVYFQFTSPTDEVIQATGELIRVDDAHDRTKSKIGKIKTVHEGRGIFSFTPLHHHSYYVRVLKPKKVKRIFPLPKPDDIDGYGLTLNTGVGVFGEGNLINVTILGYPPKKVNTAEVRVAVFKGEVELASQTTDLSYPVKSRSLEFRIPMQKFSTGVLRITAFLNINSIQYPIAERLIFLRPARYLTVEVSGDAGGVPKEEKSFEILVKDENKNPVRDAVVSVSVTDSRVLDMIEPRLHSPDILAMAFLEREVSTLTDSKHYLGGDQTDGALDLLLGTQGWRRFKYNKQSENFNPEPIIPKFYTKIRTWNTNHFRMQEDYERLNGIRQRYDFNNRCKKPFKNMFFFLLNAILRPIASLFLHTPPNFFPKVFKSVDEMFEGDYYEAASFSSRKLNFNHRLSDASATEDRVLTMQIPREYANEGFALESINRGPTITNSKMLRSNFSESLYFGELITDDNGVAKFRVTLSDSITTFVVNVNAHTTPSPRNSNALNWMIRNFLKPTTDFNWHSFGVADPVTILCKPHYFLDFKVPSQLTSGDILDLSTYFISNIESPLRVSSSMWFSESFKLMNRTEESIRSGNPVNYEITLQPQMRARRILSLVADLTFNQSHEKSRTALSIKGSNFKRMSSTGINVGDDYGYNWMGYDGNMISHNIQLGKEMGLNNEAIIHLNSIAIPLWKLEYNKTSEDSLEKRIRIYPSGFPFSQSVSSFVSSSMDSRATFLLPFTSEPNSVSLKFVLYPNLHSRFSKAIASLVREPHGCFEQMSSIVYPNIMAHQFFLKYDESVDLVLVSKSAEFLIKGFHKLLKYESFNGGFSWFAHDLADEVLSAYSLLIFHDLSTAAGMPNSVNSRTLSWLIRRRDEPTKSFLLKSHYSDSIDTSWRRIATAYILWAITSTSDSSQGFELQLEFLKDGWNASSDPYFLSLTGLTFFNIKETNHAQSVLNHLRKFQAVDGSLSGTTISAMRSTGNSLRIETTALAALAWSNQRYKFKTELKKAIEWLSSQCDDGMFGSSQGTSLTLKAFLAYETAEDFEVKQGGKIHLQLNRGKTYEIRIPRVPKSAISFSVPHEDINGLIKNRENQERRNRTHASIDIDLSMNKGFEMPFSFQLNYNDMFPPSSPNCPLSLHLHIEESNVKEGDLVPIHFEIRNLRFYPLFMPVSIIGIPSGLQVPYEQLGALQKKRLISYYEFSEREIVFYWDEMASNASIQFVIHSQASIPGRFVGPASRAYLYYSNQDKVWHMPLSCSIAPVFKKSSVESSA